MSGVVVVNQLNARVVDSGGRSVAVVDGYSLTVDNIGYLVAGTDGTSAQFLRVAPDGYLGTKLTDGIDVADILDLASSNPLAVAIVDGTGSQITSFGGGTQYQEGDVDATIVGNAMMMEGAGDTLVAAPGTAADGLLVNLGANNDVSQSGTWNITNVSGTVSLPTGASTLAEQQTQTTSLQLIDDAIYTDGSGTPSKGVLIMTTDGTNPQAVKGDGYGSVQIIGDLAHDAVDFSGPVKIGAQARQTNIQPVSDADRVNLIADDLGRLVTVSGQVRDLVIHQHTQIASSAAETTILTASTGFFLDLVQLVLTNESAVSLTVTIKDSTAGTTRMIVALASRGGAVIPFARPCKQASVSQNWTATLSSAVATVNIFAMAEKNV